MKVCSRPGCPTIIPNDAYKGLCEQHRHAYDRDRGTPAQRGYDAAHRAERARWQRLINASATVSCARCQQPLEPGQPWALDHNDDRTGWIGPSHQYCNNQAGGRAAHPAGEGS